MESFLTASIIAGTPLLLAILGEIITEKSGSLNLGVEGMMLMGAIGGFATAYHTDSALIALLAAMFCGSLGAVIFGFITVTLRANQTVTGLALTIFGTGISNYFGSGFVGRVVPEGVKRSFAVVKLPILGDIPFVGSFLFTQSTFIYLSYILVILAGIYLYHTRHGLYVTAIGENPAAADSAGIKVTLYKYLHIVVGGMLCGLSGAFLSLIYVPAWQENLSAGRGWIAVALVIFCKWNPFMTFIGAYLFGGLDIVGFRLQQYDIQVSQYVINMLPYIITISMLIFASVRGKSRGPKSLGLNYFREDR